MGTSPHGKRKGKDQEQDLVTREELDAVTRTFGERMRCQLDNANKPRRDWRFAPTSYSSRRQPRAGEKRGFHGGETLSHFVYFD